MFQFCFESRTVQSRFSVLPRNPKKNYTLKKHKSVEEETETDWKEIFYFIHDKSSSYWIIESKRKTLLRGADERKKIEDLQQVKIKFFGKKR